MINRLFRTAVAGVAAFTLGLGATVAQEKPKKITIGYLNLVNAQLVTKGLGLHEKAMPGIEFEWIKIGGGGDMLRAIAGNQLDFGGIGNPPSAIGVTRGLPIKGIFVLNMLGYVEALVVRTSKNIKSIKDLEGKTVAAPFGSTTHYLLMTAMRDAGVDTTKVKMLDLAPSDIAVAWSRGDIDAAWYWEPNLNKAVKDGGEILIHSGTMAERGYPTWDIGVVMVSFAEKYPELVKTFLKSECEAVDFWLKDPTKTAEIIAKELSLGIEDATRMMNGTEMVPCNKQLTEAYLGTPEKKGKFADTLVETAAFLTEQKRLPKTPPKADFEAFLAPDFLQKTLK
ncbi:MAG: ABC transporter substrate-binding protein [Chitinophagales bacterium]|nr:ABC transporter substrate-binding protein [Hyphomicrobiales bacterium]